MEISVDGDQRRKPFNAENFSLVHDDALSLDEREIALHTMIEIALELAN